MALGRLYLFANLWRRLPQATAFEMVVTVPVNTPLQTLQTQRN